MISQWFSGKDCERYLASPHKRRIDHIGSSLLELRYASEAVRQHLHEWLRFSAHFERDGSAPLPTVADSSIPRYLANRVEGLSASRSRVLRASVRIFLQADERGRFRRRIGSPPSTPTWFNPILTPYLAVSLLHYIHRVGCGLTYS